MRVGKRKTLPLGCFPFRGFQNFIRVVTIVSAVIGVFFFCCFLGFRLRLKYLFSFLLPGTDKKNKSNNEAEAEIPE